MMTLSTSQLASSLFTIGAWTNKAVLAKMSHPFKLPLLTLVGSFYDLCSDLAADTSAGSVVQERLRTSAIGSLADRLLPRESGG